MSTFTTSSFIAKFVNNSSIVTSTELESTIKAIINNYKAREITNKSQLIEYLNKLRIIYFLRRLKYRNTLRASKLNSKYSIYSTTTYTNYYYRTRL